MFSTPISLDRSARRLSSMALIGAAALAACDNDHTVGPNAVRIPTDASAIAVAQGGTLSIVIYDQTGAAPTNVGAQFTVAPTGGGPAQPGGRDEQHTPSGHRTCVTCCSTAR